jgi:hypothetical protein
MGTAQIFSGDGDQVMAPGGFRSDGSRDATAARSGHGQGRRTSSQLANW